MAPDVYVPVVALAHQLLRRDIALGGVAALVVVVVYVYLFVLQRGLR